MVCNGPSLTVIRHPKVFILNRCWRTNNSGQLTRITAFNFLELADRTITLHPFTHDHREVFALDFGVRCLAFVSFWGGLSVCCPGVKPESVKMTLLFTVMSWTWETHRDTDTSTLNTRLQQTASNNIEISTKDFITNRTFIRKWDLVLAVLMVAWFDSYYLNTSTYICLNNKALYSFLS